MAKFDPHKLRISQEDAQEILDEDVGLVLEANYAAPR